MAQMWKPLALFGFAVLLGVLFLAIGVDSLITGRMSRRSFTGVGFVAGRAFGAAFVCAGCAVLRALWMIVVRATWDSHDRLLRAFIWLAIGSAALTLPLLFIDVAM